MIDRATALRERPRARLHAGLHAPVDIASLAAFRVLFGLLMFAGITRFVLSGWVQVLYVEPSFHFKYWGLSWVTPWPPWGIYLHYGLLAVLALMIAAGLFYRLAAPLFTLGFAYVQAIDVTNYLNHYYLVVLLGGLLSVLPAHRAFSLDAMRRPGLAAAAVPAWTLWLLRFQIAVVYVYAGLAKFGADWLLHAQPLNLWLAARTETPVLGSLFALPQAPLVMSWAGFLFDTTVVLWLSMGRTRLLAYAVLVVFHGVTFMLFDIGLFPFIMTLSALVFFPADWPRRLLRRGARAVADVGAVPMPRLPRWGAALLVAYCAVQVLLPLRHLAYPGDVLWDEQGMRYAWKVMVREKHGAVTYRVRDRRTGRRWQVTPSRYLTPRQEGEMSSQPDLIMQLAHHVADDFAARGYDVEVRAQARVSLNGRPAVEMIDSSVDLSRLRDGIAPITWVLRAPAQPPIELRTPRLASLNPTPR